MKHKVAVFGAGLQARRRIPAILEAGDSVEIIVSKTFERSEALAETCGAVAGNTWRDALESDADVALVLTYPDTHAEISIAAMRAGKHVLCEKPLARTLQEAEAMVAVAKETGKVLKCGFNHRHHPAVKEAKSLSGTASALGGKFLFGRGKYGIAGRQGLEREWRSNPKIVGGGQLLEQGIHLVDLFSYFLGNPVEVSGMMARSGPWTLPQGIEDNGFLMCRHASGIVSSIHSSLTQWVNTFEFELYTEEGFIKVEGLGGGYGTERITWGRRTEGPFEWHTTEFRGPDTSWEDDWDDFIADIDQDWRPEERGQAGVDAMRVVFAGYESSRMGVHRNVYRSE